MKKTTKNILKACLISAVAGSALFLSNKDLFLGASSHREAPMIAKDPLADNTDLYAFRSPNDTNTVTIIANYIPFELPHGGPNYYSFDENVRYEIHIKNDTAAAKAGKDDITYRFTFTRVNEDTTTFFNIRLGKENIKTSYTLEKSTDGGMTFTTIVSNGDVPPYNIGPRSIESTVGLNSNYTTLMNNAITTASGAGGETVFCGPVDDPFFVDLGAIFDLANLREGDNGVDGLAKFNCHTIALKIPISTLQKSGKKVEQRTSILDSDFIIGVWASASRPQIKTLNTDGTVTESGDWVQISRLGMPLTNEVVIPIGSKDQWNHVTPYSEVKTFEEYLVNPELALYMDETKFASAVPEFNNLRIQSMSLGTYDFRNGMDGLFPLKGDPALDGTALADAAFGNYLLRDNKPRSVDLLPIFHTGVPNLPPYQLATGKPKGNPLAVGKPFINNFLPTFGDMLRLNMAVPVTPRNSADFSSLGLIQAAVLGLTDSRFNQNANLQFIPNMDGFPNGRRLEDDVTRIELQAVSGVVLAAIGLWYDDYNTNTSPNPVTTDLMEVLSFTTGVEKNDTTFKVAFPYVQSPWEGFNINTKEGVVTSINVAADGGLGLGAPAVALASSYPNPFVARTTIKYEVRNNSRIKINIYSLEGKFIATILDEAKGEGAHEVEWTPANLTPGMYLASIFADGKVVQMVKMSLTK